MNSDAITAIEPPANMVLSTQKDGPNQNRTGMGNEIKRLSKSQNQDGSLSQMREEDEKMDDGWTTVGHSRAAKARRLCRDSEESTKPISENSFQALELVKLKGFQNDEYTPLAMDSPAGNQKSI